MSKRTRRWAQECKEKRKRWEGGIRDRWGGG